jgi:hypothetical protein
MAWSAMINRTPARDRPGALGWRRAVLRKPGNAGGGKGPQFKTDATSGEGFGDWAVKCATLKSSDNAPIPTFLSEAGALVMSQGEPVIDPHPSGELKIAASADRFVCAIGAPLI